eukprot:maker-scaffold570_size134912-snap-gene-0.12 protein:Tk08982 transcript:maker-scaffold570_size134912-snap-gene-0.12-mRNA-1 annotation:"cleavage and polyadenylation specificity factor subunit 7"
MSDGVGGGVDIDLYADVEDFGMGPLTHEDDEAGEAGGLAHSGHEGGPDDLAGDLYDDVLASSTGEGLSAKPEVKSEERPATSAASAGLAGLTGLTGRRYQMYVGNLTWWTTDQDMADAIMSVGINDFIEVKFHENRVNGQSKGFCCVSLGSEPSMKALMEKLPKKEIHSQNPVVTYATKQALMHEVEFEEIMGRNRTVSSSAIARAVQDAAAGEFASAIETLVTAVSLIRQSKVANDDRCRILISSLQDTLHGIENKSYGARRERSRSRERSASHHRRRRSYSREREYRVPREYYHPRERSRSRERGEREHHRPREERFYEERYAKEREYRDSGRRRDDLDDKDRARH